MISTVLYILAATLAVILLVFAVYKIREKNHDDKVYYQYMRDMKKLRAERKAAALEEMERKYGHHAKYAAGDEMDRINRNSWYELPEKTPKEVYIIIGVLVLLLLIAYMGGARYI